MSSPDGFQPCPFCGDPARSGRFDLTVLGDQGEERLFFGVPAAICGICGRLVLDADALRLFGFEPADLLGAIESDSRLGELPGLDTA